MRLFGTLRRMNIFFTWECLECLGAEGQTVLGISLKMFLLVSQPWLLNEALIQVQLGRDLKGEMKDINDLRRTQPTVSGEQEEKCSTVKVIRNVPC